MPIYEYQCKKCGQFEEMQKITDPPLKRCPTCHAKVTKLISNTSFQLKGTGWYITDYGRKGGGAKSESKSDTKSEGAKEKTDTKPADKAKSSTDSKASTSHSAAA